MAQRPRETVHIGIDIGATHSAVSWWRTDERGTITDDQTYGKFATILGFSPSALANSNGTVRFIGPKATLMEGERPIKLFKAALVGLPGENPMQLVDPTGLASLAAARTQLINAACWIRIVPLISQYIVGIWDHACERATLQYPVADISEIRTVFSVPKCFDGNPRVNFEKAVQTARNQRHFGPFQLVYEHVSLLRLVMLDPNPFRGRVAAPNVVLVIDCGGLTLDGIVCRRTDLEWTANFEGHSQSVFGGGIEIDTDFEQAVTDKISAVTGRDSAEFTEPDKMVKNAMMDSWTNDIKHQFHGRLDSPISPPEAAAIGVRIDEEEVRDVLKNTVDRIVTFAKDMATLVQINKHRVTHLYLSGGLSVNDWIYYEVSHRFKAQFPSEVRRLRFGWEAVAHGLRFTPQNRNVHGAA